MAIHRMAEKYGRRPSEIVFEGESASVFEKQLFDLFVLSEGLEAEARAAKRG